MAISIFFLEATVVRVIALTGMIQALSTDD